MQHDITTLDLKEKNLDSFDHKYRNAIRVLINARSDYESSLGKVNKKFSKKESDLKLSHERNISRIKRDYSDKISYLDHSNERTLKELSVRRNKYASGIRIKLYNQKDTKIRILVSGELLFKKAIDNLNKANLAHLLSIYKNNLRS